MESALPFSVDVVDYARCAHAPLKEHMDRVARVLFEFGRPAPEQAPPA